MNRVIISGAGVISPLANDPQLFFSRLLEGCSGVRLLAAPWAATLGSPCAAFSDLDVDAQFPKIKRVAYDRVTMLALLAARQAVAQSGICFDGVHGEEAGIFWGTGIGGATTLESAYRDLLVGHVSRLNPTTIVKVMNNAAAGHLAIEFGIRGSGQTYSSACSSSAVAIGEAFRAVKFGLVRTAIAGGAEALLTEGVIKAWDSLGTLARMDKTHPETSCRPFAADRSGFILGEGAAALVIEQESSARKRGATILAELAGYGNTTDASHITLPDANGQARAIRQALAEAQLEPRQIDYINAHGTGTKAGDIAETRSIKEAFGDHAYGIPISATKALHGHLMGAGGAVEFVAALETLRTRTAPPTAHLWHPDPECDLDFVPIQPRYLKHCEAVMSNSFGFGGNNAVLVARRYVPDATAA